jgi:hypothetical protein
MHGRLNSVNRLCMDPWVFLEKEQYCWFEWLLTLPKRACVVLNTIKICKECLHWWRLCRPPICMLDSKTWQIRKKLNKVRNGILKMRWNAWEFKNFWNGTNPGFHDPSRLYAFCKSCKCIWMRALCKSRKRIQRHALWVQLPACLREGVTLVPAPGNLPPRKHTREKTSVGQGICVPWHPDPHHDVTHTTMSSCQVVKLHCSAYLAMSCIAMSCIAMSCIAVHILQWGERERNDTKCVLCQQLGVKPLRTHVRHYFW